MKLENKIAIVTGAAAGIGRKITELFIAEGAKVIACDMSALPYELAGVEAFELNVRDVTKCEAMFNHVIQKYGKIDILINNAGITQDSMTAKMSEEQWDLVVDVNLKGVFNITRHVGPHMAANGGGAIVNISSIVGEYGNIGQANYAATKSAIYGLTKSWAKEFARKGAGVRVNTVSPGYTMTDILKTVSEDLLNKFSAQTMLGRLGQPEEIAKAVLFLASDDASYITGHNLSVDGGMRL